MLAAHLHILALWLLLWVVFYGWGTIVCRIARCNRDDPMALLINPFIGMACVIGVLQIWHLFAPVNSLACGLLCGGGILAAAAYGSQRLSLIAIAVRNHPLLATLTALLVLWLVNRSLGSLPPYTDQGLYYLNTIRWASDYPIVPGLANLHIRLGFNNSIFLLHAMLENITGRGYSAHVLNGFVAALSVPIIVHGLRSVFLGAANERQAGWFTLAMAMIVAIAAVDGRIYSTTPDFPAGMLVTITAWRLLVMGAIGPESKDVLLRWNLLTIAILASAAVTVKTLVIFFAGFAAIALVAFIYRLNRDRSTRPLLATAKSLGFVAMWSTLFIVPWVARGYILTGYPLFPSTIAGAPVDWRYDEEVAVSLRHIYHAWERTHDYNPETAFQPGWGWLPNWIVQVVLLRGPVEIALPALIAFASMLWLGWRALKRPCIDDGPTDSGPWNAPDSSSLAQFSALLLAAAYAGAIVLWFLTAPGPRFGCFAWWGFAAICVGMVSRTVPVEWTTRHRRLILAALAILLLLPMADEIVRIETRHRYKPNHSLYGQHFYRYYPVVWPTGDGYPPLPKGDIVEMKTKSGLTVYVGVTQPDGYPSLLWDSPLPAARYFNPNLELRRPGNLSRGFKTVSFGDEQNGSSRGYRQWTDEEPRQTPEGTNEYVSPPPPPTGRK